MNKQKKLYFAPGFLGLPEDGNVLQELGRPLTYFDFFSQQGLFREVLNSNQDPALFLDQIASVMHAHIQADFPQVQKVLVGYSLGGRILAHVFLQNPAQYERLILISSHLGLKRDSEKSERIASDLSWSKSFLMDAWSSVLTAWNEQPVLSSSSQTMRHEAVYDRGALSAAFSHASLGLQKNLEQDLAMFRDRIVLIAGEKDQKFSELLRHYSTLGFCTRIISNCGHRVLFDQPRLFLEAMKGIIN